MTDRKTYSVSKIFWLLPAAMTLILVFYFLQPQGFGSKALMAAMGLLAWYACLSVPHTIHITEEGRIIFISVIKTVEIHVRDISAIEKGGKTTVIIHRNGKIEVSYIINNLEEFCNDLKKLNPSVTESVGPLTAFARSPAKIFILLIISVLLALSIAGLVIVFSSEKFLTP